MGHAVAPVIVSRGTPERRFRPGGYEFAAIDTVAAQHSADGVEADCHAVCTADCPAAFVIDCLWGCEVSGYFQLTGMGRVQCKLFAGHFMCGRYDFISFAGVGIEGEEVFVAGVRIYFLTGRLRVFDCPAGTLAEITPESVTTPFISSSQRIS